MKWEEKTIDSLIEKVIDYRGKTPKKSDYGIKLVTAKIIKQGRISLDGPYEYIKPETYEEVMRRGIPLIDDILITTEAPLGEVALIKSEEIIALAQRVILLRINKKVADSKFIYQALKTPLMQGRLYARATGTTVLGIKNPELRKVEIPLPPLPTQRKIASILSAYDDLIENNLKRIKLLEEKAFLRYKQIVRDEKMNEFLIEEICDTIGGGTPSTGNNQYWDGGDILWFSPTDLTKHNSIVLLDSEKKITELGLQKSSAKLVPPKTILMTSRASIGYFGLINRSVSTNQGFINIIPKKDYYRAYLLFNLKSRKEEIIGNANGSTFLEISKTKFRQMKVKFPVDESILLDFETEFESIFNFIENLLKQNTKLREARDILLPRLMNGQIEV